MKNKEYLIRFLFLLVSVILVGGIIILIFNFRTGAQEVTPTVGAVFIGTSDDKGWNEGHYKGVTKACEKNSCEVYTKLSVPEEDREAVTRAVSDLIRQGCNCIFLTSFGYGDYVDEMAEDNPQVAFYVISPEPKAENAMSYFARMYQARYLAGIVAGAATESDKLAYISAMPNPESIRAIDAYALGVQRSNPDAKVLVKYTGSWEDREAEEAAVRELAATGADVVTFQEDRPYTIEVAEELGLFSTGYAHVAENYSERFLTAAVFKWDTVYDRIIKDYLSGRANFSQNYWFGIEDGAVSLSPYSALVKNETRQLVEQEKKRLQTWRDVFSGEIYDNKGRRRCLEDERVSDDMLFNHIDWYVKGVEVYE